MTHLAPRRISTLGQTSYVQRRGKGSPNVQLFDLSVRLEALKSEATRRAAHTFDITFVGIDVEVPGVPETASL